MKINEIFKSDTEQDHFASIAYSGKLIGKKLVDGLELEKFMGKDKHNQFVSYEGYYEFDGIELQVDSLMRHPESEQGPAEYDGIDEEVDVMYDGRFYYGYDPDEQQPHYWRFVGSIAVHMNSGTRSGMEFEGVGDTWKESLNDMLRPMYNYAHENVGDIFNGN